MRAPCDPPADRPAPSGVVHRVRALAVGLLTLPLRLYRRFLSPLKPATCRFSPTCSEYAIRALEAHGPLRGAALATWRLLRCQPFARAGHDPVPDPRPKPARPT
jgi:putative membrane protein insertion efficiency factor